MAYADVDNQCGSYSVVIESFDFLDKSGASTSAYKTLPLTLANNSNPDCGPATTLCQDAPIIDTGTSPWILSQDDGKLNRNKHNTHTHTYKYLHIHKHKYTYTYMYAYI